MRLLVGITFAAAAFASLNFAGKGQNLPADEPGAPPGSTRFDLQLVGDADTCRIEKGDRTDGRLSDLKLETGCLEIYPALRRAKFWRERSDGSMALASGDGKPVMVFALSDGLAFESIEPANPLITLTSVD